MALLPTTTYHRPLVSNNNNTKLCLIAKQQHRSHPHHIPQKHIQALVLQAHHGHMLRPLYMSSFFSCHQLSINLFIHICRHITPSLSATSSSPGENTSMWHSYLAQYGEPLTQFRSFGPSSRFTSISSHPIQQMGSNKPSLHQCNHHILQQRGKCCPNPSDTYCRLSYRHPNAILFSRKLLIPSPLWYPPSIIFFYLFPPTNQCC